MEANPYSSPQGWVRSRHPPPAASSAANSYFSNHEPWEASTIGTRKDAASLSHASQDPEYGQDAVDAWLLSDDTPSQPKPVSGECAPAAQKSGVDFFTDEDDDAEAWLAGQTEETAAELPTADPPKSTTKNESEFPHETNEDDVDNWLITQEDQNLPDPATQSTEVANQKAPAVADNQGIEDDADAWLLDPDASSDTGAPQKTSSSPSHEKPPVLSSTGSQQQASSQSEYVSREPNLAAEQSGSTVVEDVVEVVDNIGEHYQVQAGSSSQATSISVEPRFPAKQHHFGTQPPVQAASRVISHQDSKSQRTLSPQSDVGSLNSTSSPFGLLSTSSPKTSASATQHGTKADAVAPASYGKPEAGSRPHHHDSHSIKDLNDHQKSSDFSPQEDTQDLVEGDLTAALFDMGIKDNENEDEFFSKPQETLPGSGGEDANILSPPQQPSTSYSDPSHQESTPAAVDEFDSQKGGGATAGRDEVDTLAASDSAIVGDNSANNGTLETMWQEALADEDEDGFLETPPMEDTEIDAAAFLGSDDEGFLEDIDEPVQESLPTPTTLPAIPATAPNPYAALQAVPKQLPAQILPPVAHPDSNWSYQPPPAPPIAPAVQYGQFSQSRPELVKSQSFADKSKGGYSSPYDIPTDLVSNVVKPRKRTAIQAPTREQVPAPPRSSSALVSAGLPGTGPTPFENRVAERPPSSGNPSPPAASKKSDFFEDLPVTVKPRPSSRHNNSVPPPISGPPIGLRHSSGPPLTSRMPPPAALLVPNSGLGQPPGPTKSTAPPDAVGPYAALQSAQPALPPSGNASRYSPAPTQPLSKAVPPPSVTNRYSPASAGARSASSHAHPSPAPPPPAALPHLPRTSSPLAHFEASSHKLATDAQTHAVDGHTLDRRHGPSAEPRLNRVPSLPPTREVDEEEEKPTQDNQQAVIEAEPASESTAGPLPSSLGAPGAATRAPAMPPANHVSSSLPSMKRTSSNYLPQASSKSQFDPPPPPRPQTQSPGLVHKDQLYQPADLGSRPPSVHSPHAQVGAAQQTPAQAAAGGDARGRSLDMDALPPTDGREHDPLQRWRGAPIFAWGVGGTMVTTFPKSIPRYVSNQTTPSVIRTSGEVKLQIAKEIDPFQDRLAKFPGPLRGKSKKKDAVAWLIGGIELLEHETGHTLTESQSSLNSKRTAERLLLWKILRVFVEFDGMLEGDPAVEKAVKDILSPEPGAVVSEKGSFSAGSTLGAELGLATSMQADGIEPAAMEQMRLHLFNGDREAAVWAAVDKRLWGHAMLISHTVSPDLYRRVAQEFVRKEVNYPGHKNESVAALYKVLSGNFDDCVDELVPVHARAGLQLVPKEATSEPARDATEGLDKWRETLTLVLSNRSSEDIRALNALGKLLLSYGRTEAAQICFIFSRSLSVFGGADDPKSDFVLIGTDHRRESEPFSKDIEAVQLSEMYEYGTSLAGGAAAAAGAPHLAAYKLQYAMTLAEHGYRDKALQYCDAIAAAIVAQTRRSPYYHVVLEAAVDNFLTRLKQAPKELSSSWISKPSMNKVSDSMWNRFNKFVAGDENENGGSGGPAEGENGPFARIASTPNLSRSPSVSNFEAYGGGLATYQPGQVSQPASGLSRYAPMPTQPGGSSNPYAPASQHFTPPVASRRSSSDFPHANLEPSYPGLSSPPPQTGAGYVPTTRPPSARVPSTAGNQLAPAGSAKEAAAYAPPAMSRPPTSSGYQQYGLQEPPQDLHGGEKEDGTGSSASEHGPQLPPAEKPPRNMMATPDSNRESVEQANEGGYEPPSYQPYSYEPPSYEPQPESPGENEGGPALKSKKSFMVDDEDDEMPRAQSKDDKDRENEEMFRKAAEEDGKKLKKQDPVMNDRSSNMHGTAKRAASQQPAKKGWGLSGWFGGSKKTNASEETRDAGPNKPIRAKLGEASSFVYDPDLKRWINKKPGAENAAEKKAAPPPPRSNVPPVSRTPSNSSLRAAAATATPPPAGPPTAMPEPKSRDGAAPPAMPPLTNPSLAGATSRPVSRPSTSMSNASSIDDLLGPPGPRKAGQKKSRKGGRYVDVMDKQT